MNAVTFFLGMFVAACLSMTSLWTVSVHAAGLANSAWPMFMHDARHTGQSTHDGPSTSTVHVKWKYHNAARFKTAPTIGEDGTVYIGAGFAPLCAVDPDTGAELWCTDGGGDAAWSSPTISQDGTIYIGARDNKVWAVNPNGSVKWRYKKTLDGDMMTSPLIDPINGRIYASCGCLSSGIVFAFNPTPLSGVFDPLPAPAVPQGDLAWEFKVGLSTRGASPAQGADGTIYVSTTDGKLHALIPGTTGATLKWPSVKYGKKNLYSGPSISNTGIIYVGSYTAITAINSNTGQIQWSIPTAGRVDSTPAIASNGTIYFGTWQGPGGTFYALNPDGSIKWTRNLGGPTRGSGAAIGANGIVYATAGKSVFALHPNDGHTIWQYQTGGSIHWSSPSIAADGTLYIGSEDHYLYAFVED